MCNIISECNILFPSIIVFSTRFSNEVFKEAYAYYGKRPRSTIKHTNKLYLREERKKNISSSQFIYSVLLNY
jgi:hypothetical protein